MKKYEADLKAAKSKCTQMLRSGDVVVDRQKKISSIVDGTLKDHSHFDRPLEYITERTKTAAIRYNPEWTTIDQLASYGHFSENEVNQLIDIPIITLNTPSKVADTGDGYKIRMKWNTTKQPEDINDFSVRFRISSDDDDDDEKKAVDEWLVASCEQIEKVQDTQFAANIESVFMFDTTYQCQVTLKLTNPFPMEITSNLNEHEINGLLKGDAVQIPLKEHSCRKIFDSEYRVQQLFTSTSGYYASDTIGRFKPDENDWIIVKTGSDDLFFPKRFSIKNHYWKEANGVKTMRIFIGDGKNDWYQFEPKTVNVAEQGQRLQSFEIDGVSDQIIKKKRLCHFKLEFISNHGATLACRFIVQEFHLFGVKI